MIQNTPKMFFFANFGQHHTTLNSRGKFTCVCIEILTGLENSSEVKWKHVQGHRFDPCVIKMDKQFKNNLRLNIEYVLLFSR